MPLRITGVAASLVVLVFAIVEFVAVVEDVAEGGDLLLFGEVLLLLLCFVLLLGLRLMTLDGVLLFRSADS